MQRNSKDQVVNKSHKADFEYIIKLSRTLMRTYAFWPPDYEKSKCIRVLLQLANVFCCLCVINFIIPMVMKIIFVDKTMDEVVLTCGFAIYFILAIFKWLFLNVGRNKILMCIENMYEDWKYVDGEQREILLRNFNAGKPYMLSGTIFMYFTWFTWNIKPLVAPPRIVDGEPYHVLSYPAYYPSIEVNRRPHVYYVTAIHSVGSFLNFCVLLSTMAITTTVVMHLCGQFDILSEYLKSLGTSESTGNDKYVQSLLPTVVKKQNDLFRYSNLIDDIFDGIFFTEWVNCVDGVCFCAYMFVTESRGVGALVNDLLSAVVLSYIFFIFCYLGDQLKEKVMKKAFAFLSLLKSMHD